jgi:hypothetical protein
MSDAFDRADRESQIDAFLLTLGIHYAAQFVPFSMSRNAKSAPKLSDLTLNWRVSLSKASAVLTTDYQAGIGHIPGYSVLQRQTVDSVDAVRRTCESGKHYQAGRTYAFKDLDPPALRDVLYCLIQDASAIDCPRFEDWAADYGFDTDSRKGEAAYRACLETGLSLRSLIGDAAITTLRGLFQDY